MQEYTQQNLNQISKYGYVYLSYCKITGKIYIGQKKSKVFINNYFGSGKLIKLAINKYGVENFNVYLIDWSKSKEDLDYKEKYWIAKYNSVNKEIGYNISRGGLWGDCLTTKTPLEKEEIINKIVKTRHLNRKLGITKPYKLSEETKKKISIATSGKNNPMYGKSAMKGRHHSEETKRKISEAAKGRHHSEETRKKISESNKLARKSYNCWTGRHHSEETKNKLSKIVSENNKGKIWICNNECTKFIKEEDLDYYLLNGFILGRKWVK